MQGHLPILKFIILITSAKSLCLVIESEFTDLVMDIPGSLLLPASHFIQIRDHWKYLHRIVIYHLSHILNSWRRWLFLYYEFNETWWLIKLGFVASILWLWEWEFSKKPKELGMGGETLSGHCEFIPDLGSDGHGQWSLSFHFHLLKY